VYFPEIITRITEFTSPDQPLYLVGGAVRDYLLGHPVKDFDLVGSGDIRKIARHFANQLGGVFYVLDEQRNTCRVLIEEQIGSRRIFDFSVQRGDTIIDDLALRDFTINAMAVDLIMPEMIIDPYKGGRDLQEKRLRTVSQHSLQDDALRVIRGIRYAVALGLKVEPQTVRLLKEAIPGLTTISIERKRDELCKILNGEKVHVALQLLLHFEIFKFIPLQIRADHREALDESRVLEEVISAITTNSPGNKQAAFHLTSLMLTFGQFKAALQDHYFKENSSGRSRKALIYLSALLDGSSRYTINEIRDSLALSIDEAEIIDTLLRCRDYAEQILSGDIPSALETYRYFKVTGLTGIDLIFFSLASFHARNAADQDQGEWLKRLEIAGQLVSAWFNQPAAVHPRPLLDGDEIMRELGLTPSPRIGELIENLICEQVSRKIRTKDDALEWIRKQNK